jgi:translocator protein
MRWSAFAKSVAPTVAAAVLGNAFVGRDSLSWFTGLRRPRMQVPMPAFVTVGGLYYVALGTVTYRAVVREDGQAYRLALAVLAGNEVWNGVFFGRRSTRAGFLGILAFLLPLGLLQARVATDRVSTMALTPYTAWVLVYDLPWTYQLWRLNPGPADGADGGRGSP